MQLMELKKGSRFVYAQQEWILLDRQEDKHLCLSAATAGARQYDRGMNARFDQAAISEWLNGAYYNSLLSAGAAAVDFNMLMMNLSISTTAGDCIYVNRVGILSLHQWRHYLTAISRQPLWQWQWTCSIIDGINGPGLCCVAGKDGNYVYYPPNHPYPQVRPVLSLRGWAEVSKE